MAQLGAAVSLILLSHSDSFPLALMLMTFAIGMTGFHNAGAMVMPQDIAPEYAGSVAGFSNTVSTFSGTCNCMMLVNIAVNEIDIAMKFCR